jgi:hypothetical protein
MADPGGAPTPTSGSLQALIDAAKEGKLTVRMDLEKFVYADRDCNFFKQQITQIQRILEQISQQQHWGLGEDYAANSDRDLVSSKVMVKRWREKAQGAPNNLHGTLDSHWQTVDDFQTLFRTVREKITGVDTDQAARYKQLEQSLPQQNPAPQRWLGAGLTFQN